MIYIAYGSNLNVAQMKHRCPNAKYLGKATLEGYTPVFRRYLNVEKDGRCKTPVGLWDVDAEDLKALDSYEGYPRLYDRIDVKVRVKGGYLEGLMYVMTDYYKTHLPLGTTDNYVATCYQGYKDFGLDTDILGRALLKSVVEAVV